MKSKVLRRSNFVIAGILVLAMIFSLVAIAAGGTPEKVDVIVGFKAAPGASGRALIEGLGGTVRSSYTLIPAIAATVPAPAGAALRSNPNVAYVEADGFRTLHTDSAVGELQWGVNRIDAEAVWDVLGGTSGAGVKVADLDTGIDITHPDLAANILEVWSVAGSATASSPSTSGQDQNGHGTATAGVIAAVRNSTGVVGVAPSASIIAIQISKGPRLQISDIIDGIELAVNRGAQVVNMSFGGGFSEAEANTVTAAYNAGLLLVASAGNSSGGAISYPAALPEVIAVTASTITDGLASFSSVGPDAELIAPGANIYTTALGGGYAHVDGTSFSAPHVSGAAALVLAKNPTFTNAQVRTRLNSTAENLGLSANQQGNGLVDAEKAALLTTVGNNLPGGGGGGGGGAATTVRVFSITYSTSGGKTGNKNLNDTVSLGDNLGNPVAGASVSVTLNNTTTSQSWNGTGTTGTNGAVTFVLSNAPSGCYATIVTNVVALGLNWDSVTPVNGFCK